MTAADALQAHFDTQTDRLIDLTNALVAIESPTDDRDAVNRVKDLAASLCRNADADITIHPREEVGDIIEARWNIDQPGKPILLLAHMDTVHPIGTLERNPIRQDDGRLYGPGGYDMKSAIAQALVAIDGLIELDAMPDRPITLLLTSDEETGSLNSRELIQEKARESALALVLEAALSDGSMKTWRKSVARFTLTATGIASHAGGNHESGLNAIEEMAHHIIALQRMTRYKVGTTVNVGVIEGGTKSNVVPDTCTLTVDARAMTDEEIERLTAEIYALEPVMPGSKLDIDGGFDRPPMQRNEQMIATFEQAKTIAAKYDITLREGGTGGASDGNYTAATGTPTLDGLGPLGEGAHTEHENVLISDLPRRALLLAALLKDWPV